MYQRRINPEHLLTPSGLRHALCPRPFALRSLLFALCAVPFALCAGAADIKLDVSANRNTLYQGETFVLTVKVSGSDSTTPPDLSAITNAVIRSLGNHSESRSNITIVNGRMTRESFTGRIFSYEIKPFNAGRFLAGPVRLTLDGQTYIHPGPVLDVAGLEKQDWVLLSITPSRESVLVDEPFTITFSLIMRRLPAPYADVDPMAPADPPALTIPFLDGNAIDGLETPDLRPLLEPRCVDRRNPGFTLNNYETAPNVFDIDSMMNGDRRARFLFERKPVTTNNANGFAYSIALAYTPRAEGSYTFGPAEFKGRVITAVDESGRGQSKPVFAIGPACVVRVVPPPDEGRPASYIGLLSTNLLLDATLDAQTCNVGDPLKLTLTLSGSIRLANAQPPLLAALPGLADSFRIYDDTVNTRNSATDRKFIYTIRPTRPGSFELPPIEMSYYDTRERAYRIVKTRPLPLQVRETAAVVVSNILFAATNTVSRHLDVAGLTPVISPLNVDDTGPDSTRLTPATWQWVTLAAGPSLFIITLAVRQWTRSSPRLTRARRRRNALRSAGEALARLPSDPLAAHRSAGDAIRNYVADRFNTPAAGLTPPDAARILNQAGISKSLADELHDLLELHFNAAYAAASTAALLPIQPSDVDVILQALQRIDAASRPSSSSMSRSASTTLLFVVTALSASLPIHSRADTTLERRFLWDQANSQMISARNDTDFLQAAATYRRLVDAGACNGPLFYNLGTACLQARHYTEALTCFERAERYIGADPDLADNLSLALARGDTSGVLPWYRFPLFWHFGLGAPLRLSVAVFAFLTCWFGLTLRVLGWQQMGRRILILSLILLVLFGSSAITTLVDESRDLQPGWLKLTDLAKPESIKGGRL